MSKHGAKKVRHKIYTWFEVKDQVGPVGKSHEVLVKSEFDPVRVASELERIYMGMSRKLDTPAEVKLRHIIQRARGSTPEAS